MSVILHERFYERDPLTVARDLLGRLLVHEAPDGVTSGRIVETEVYMGPEDKASHAYGGRRTKRNEVQFGPKGRAYVYQVYGMYYCFDTTVGCCIGKPEVVLVRALEPIDGVQIMKKRRGIAGNPLTDLTSGPSKLCMSMGITTALNGTDLSVPPLYIERGESVKNEQVKQARRVGVDYAGEWKNMPWRFLVAGNPFVSKR